MTKGASIAVWLEREHVLEQAPWKRQERAACKRQSKVVPVALFVDSEEYPEALMAETAQQFGSGNISSTAVRADIYENELRARGLEWDPENPIEPAIGPSIRTGYEAPTAVVLPYDAEPGKLYDAAAVNLPRDAEPDELYDAAPPSATRPNPADPRSAGGSSCEQAHVHSGAFNIAVGSDAVLLALVLVVALFSNPMVATAIVGLSAVLKMTPKSSRTSIEFVVAVATLFHNMTARESPVFVATSALAPAPAPALAPAAAQQDSLGIVEDQPVTCHDIHIGGHAVSKAQCASIDEAKRLASSYDIDVLANSYNDGGHLVLWL